MERHFYDPFTQVYNARPLVGVYSNVLFEGASDEAFDTRGRQEVPHISRARRRCLGPELLYILRPYLTLRHPLPWCVHTHSAATFINARRVFASECRSVLY